MPAQDGPDAGHKLLELEGLGEVVVGPQVEALHAVVHLVAGGEHDHGHAGDLAQPAAKLEAVDAGQHEVEDDEVWRLGKGHAQARLAVPGALGVEALVAEAQGEKIDDAGFVVDYQKARARGSQRCGGFG